MYCELLVWQNYVVGIFVREYHPEMNKAQCIMHHVYEYQIPGINYESRTSTTSIRSLILFWSVSIYRASIQLYSRSTFNNLSNHRWAQTEITVVFIVSFQFRVTYRVLLNVNVVLENISIYPPVSPSVRVDTYIGFQCTYTSIYYVLFCFVLFFLGGGGGRAHLLPALVIWSLTMNPFRDGAPLRGAIIEL